MFRVRWHIGEDKGVKEFDTEEEGQSFIDDLIEESACGSCIITIERPEKTNGSQIDN